MVEALEPEEGKVTFFLGVFYHLIKMIMNFFFLTESEESLVIKGEFLFSVAFSIPLQKGYKDIYKDRCNDRIQRQNNNPTSY